ncbi:MAG TPA: EAL domain-containing protein [Vicinamibacteria bacterium]|nr:EAL domain-containing protein [Vicinamibacteria bacterium]
MTASSVTHKPRVLVAEDDTGLLEVLTTLLTESGYEVLPAARGLDAIALLRQASVDIVLTDIVMPDATGVDVLRAARERHLDTPVILMTGNPSVPTAVEALSLGALSYLVKPVAEATLLATLSEALGLARLASVRRQAVAELGGGRLIADRAGLETAFTRAQAGMWMAYQPVIWAETGKLFGHEALLRTTDSELNSASAFLDVAERLDQIPELGRSIRQRIAQNLATLPEAVLVNIHPLELMDRGLAEGMDALSSFADRVVLEITERASLEGLGDLRERGRRLRERGFRLAIDDLGAGYAALSSFASLEPDLVKIDLSLVHGLDQHATKRKLVTSIVELCRDLGILVVAEGVETAAERDVLMQVGCDLLQGYLFGRPEARSVDSRI